MLWVIALVFLIGSLLSYIGIKYIQHINKKLKLKQKYLRSNHQPLYIYSSYAKLSLLACIIFGVSFVFLLFNPQTNGYIRAVETEEKKIELFNCNYRDKTNKYQNIIEQVPKSNEEMNFQIPKNTNRLVYIEGNTITTQIIGQEKKERKFESDHLISSSIYCYNNKIHLLCSYYKEDSYFSKLYIYDIFSLELAEQITIFRRIDKLKFINNKVYLLFVTDANNISLLDEVVSFSTTNQKYYIDDKQAYYINELKFYQLLSMMIIDLKNLDIDTINLYCGKYYANFIDNSLFLGLDLNDENVEKSLVLKYDLNLGMIINKFELNGLIYFEPQLINSKIYISCVTDDDENKKYYLYTLNNLLWKVSVFQVVQNKDDAYIPLYLIDDQFIIYKYLDELIIKANDQTISVDYNSFISIKKDTIVSIYVDRNSVLLDIYCYNSQGFKKCFSDNVLEESIGFNCVLMDITEDAIRAIIYDESQLIDFQYNLVNSKEKVICIKITSHSKVYLASNRILYFDEFSNMKFYDLKNEREN